MEQLAESQITPVRSAAVEQALTELWRPGTRVAGGGDPKASDESRPAVTRAAAWNLVVPCDARAEVAARHAVMEVVAAQPSRVLLLVTEEASPNREMSAAVTALCHRLADGMQGHPTSTRRQVCCELITLRAGGEDAHHLADAARALLVPDLPVAVWWPDGHQEGAGGRGEPPLHAPLAAELAPLADRWILDTGATTGATALGATLAFTRRLRGMVSDLAWMRLLPWRELTAQFFDPPAFRRHLERLDRLEVWTASESEPPAEPLLWLGWVAGRQGWQVEAAVGQGEWRLRQGDKAVLAAVRRWDARSPNLGPIPDTPVPAFLSDGHTTPGEMLAVRLSASNPEIAFTLARGPEAECATLEVTTEGACPLPRVVRLPPAPRARLLAAALSQSRRDAVYPEALSIAGRLT